MKKSGRPWIVVACYVALMYLATFIASATRLLDDRVRTANLSIVAYIVFGIALIALVVLRFGFKNAYGWIYTGFFAALLAMVAFYLPEPKDRLHFLEYCLMFVLIYAAFKRSVGGPLRYALALISIFALGIFDETLQSSYPNGFFDFSDALHDAFAGYVAAGAVLIWERL
ncbi:MAG: VanZ family protein [Pseudomonadota bacterium]